MLPMSRKSPLENCPPSWNNSPRKQHPQKIPPGKIATPASEKLYFFVVVVTSFRGVSRTSITSTMDHLGTTVNSLNS